MIIIIETEIDTGKTKLEKEDIALLTDEIKASIEKMNYKVEDIRLIR